MKKYYIVTFRWYDTSTYCINIAIADNMKSVFEHYNKKSDYVTVNPADENIIESAKRKGMPIRKI